MIRISARIRSILAAAVLLYAVLLTSPVSMRADTLQLHGYLDYAPAPGQYIVNGYVSATATDTETGQSWQAYVMCLDYNHLVIDTLLYGTIGVPTSTTHLIQGLTLLAYAGTTSTPLSPTVDRLAYTVWDEKPGVWVPDVYGSHLASQQFTTLFESNPAFFTALVQSNVLVFVPDNYTAERYPAQAFGWVSQQLPGGDGTPGTPTPEPATWGMGGLCACGIGLWKRWQKGEPR